VTLCGRASRRLRSRSATYFLTTGALAVAALFVLASEAAALGEIFKLNTTGTEYCESGASSFTPSTDTNLWFRVDSETQGTLSATRNFKPGTTVPLSGKTYLIGPKLAAFVGGVLLNNDGFVSLRGTANLKANGTVKNLKGVFIQYNLFDDGCFSSGDATTGPRLN
jgi:hypothetical protein